MLRESRRLVVAFLAVAVLAATVGSGSLHAADLSWLSAPSSPEVSLDASIPSFMAAKPGITPKATCSAWCDTYTLTCTYTPPGATCSAADRNCSASPQQPGFVQCGTNPKVYCTPDCPLPPECTEGQFMTEVTGNCCDTGSTEKNRFKCIGGQWQYLSTLCGPPLCGPPIQ